MDLPPTQPSSSSSSSSSNSSTGNQPQTLIPSDQTLTLTLTLIPGFPHNITTRILISLPYSHRCRLRRTSRAWHAFLSQASVAPLRRSLHLPPRHILCFLPSDPSIVRPYLYDPSAAAWTPLPLLPHRPFLSGLSNFAAMALGHHVYVLGGSNLDSRSFPLGLPLLTATVYRFDLSAFSAPWTRLPDMILPRASFASTPIANGIVVAGGGSGDTYFPYSVTRMSSVEVFDVRSREWTTYDGFPGYRSGCVGFLRRMDGDEGEDEFWVMGGHADYRLVEGVVSANLHYKNVLVLGLRSGKWREGGDMWEDGERQKLGQVAVVDGVNGEAVEVFMLDQNVIFRYFI